MKEMYGEIWSSRRFYKLVDDSEYVRNDVAKIKDSLTDSKLIEVEAARAYISLDLKLKMGRTNLRPRWWRDFRPTIELA